MNKTNQFKSSSFFMSEGDILHMLIIDENGVEITIELMGDETTINSAPGQVVALDATSVTSSGFIANWLFTENADGYYFNLATDPDMTPHIAGYINLDVGNVNHVHITGLTSGVTYYYQVSAYNNIGEGIESNVISTLIISTLPLVDKDGNVYTTIVIGNQEWTVENLMTTTYADGTAIPEITVDGSPITWTDWFLPSRNELTAIHTELYLHGVGGFDDGFSSYYCSSSEATSSPTTHIWCRNMLNNWEAEYQKSLASYFVRACRKFTSITPSYSLRDIGPAGGLIFWKSGNDYLEAAPSDQSASQIWSNIDGVAIGTTSTAIGTGQANTTAIIGQASHTDSAAKLCDDLSVAFGGTGWIGDLTGAYCWYENDLPSHGVVLGALYNQYAVDNAHGLVYFERGGTQETGWKVPSGAEWDQLIAFADGTTVAGGRLKEVGLAHWTTPNAGATDLYGFKALPGGERQDTDGSFDNIGTATWFWTTDELYSYYLSNFDAVMLSWIHGKTAGLSVRCMRQLYTGTPYVEYIDPLTPSITYRKGVRDNALRVDVTLTSTGFSGTEDIDWANIKSV
jgi:uncharacterized protein (TIGR02145 family)